MRGRTNGQQPAQPRKRDAPSNSGNPPGAEVNEVFGEYARSVAASAAKAKRNAEKEAAGGFNILSAIANRYRATRRVDVIDLDAEEEKKENEETMEEGEESDDGDADRAFVLDDEEGTAFAEQVVKLKAPKIEKMTPAKKSRKKTTKTAVPESEKTIENPPTFGTNDVSLLDDTLYTVDVTGALEVSEVDADVTVVSTKEGRRSVEEATEGIHCLGARKSDYWLKCLDNVIVVEDELSLSPPKAKKMKVDETKKVMEDETIPSDPAPTPVK